jgi:hypothetical protein
MKRLVFVGVLSGVLGGALSPALVNAGVEAMRIVQASFDGNLTGGLLRIGAAASAADNSAGIAMVSDQGGFAPICWEASPAGTDTCLNVDANEVLYTGGFSGFQFLSGTAGLTIDSGGVERLTLEQADVGATCATGEIKYDTGGATRELCYCHTTNTWTCFSADTAAGPTN